MINLEDDLERYMISDSHTFNFKTLNYLRDQLLPLFAPWQVDEYKYRFIVLAGPNFSYHNPFMTCELYRENCTIRFYAQTIDDQMYGFWDTQKSEEKSIKKFNELVQYFKAMYLPQINIDKPHMWVALGQFPKWEDFQHYMETIFYIHDFDT